MYSPISRVPKQQVYGRVAMLVIGRDLAAQAVSDRHRVDREDVHNQLERLGKRIDALLAKREEVDVAVRKDTVGIDEWSERP